MDIDKWKNDFPFLRDVWKTIDDFDEDLNNDPNDNEYFVVCKQIIDISKGELEKHKNVCKKLLRNLGHRSKNDKFLTHSSERCNNLNNWIYNSIKKHQIPENIITGCFDDYNVIMKGIEQPTRCFYYSYDKNYIEPINVIKLQNFHDNINIIESTMKNKIEPNYSLCQKYICECVNIYKSTFKEHCSPVNSTNDKIKKTCDILSTFKSSYTTYLYNKDGLRDNIPSLDSEESVPFKICTVEEEKTRRVYASMPGAAQEPGTRTAVGSEPGSTPIVAEQSDNSMPFNTTSVVSAMAAIPPFLALIYKFTPVGTMIRRKNKQSINTFNHLDDEIEKELFYRRLENGSINSSPATYNVGYEPI
ncbi:PIR protein [Plasmodium vivax]|uniref:VIR protein n=1 Tax=Plasmodium vivax TaxID=5855 RepID=A0A564ZWI0_PLAVI|nr:PIR protein [Plasmodium vivax]